MGNPASLCHVERRILENGGPSSQKKRARIVSDPCPMLHIFPPKSPAWLCVRVSSSSPRSSMVPDAEFCGTGYVEKALVHLRAPSLSLEVR